MPLPQYTAGTSISMNQVNVELGLPGTTTISLNQSTVRALFGVSSGPIGMLSGFGKSNISTPYITSFTFTDNGYTSLVGANTSPNNTDGQNSPASYSNVLSIRTGVMHPTNPGAQTRGSGAFGVNFNGGAGTTVEWHRSATNVFRNTFYSVVTSRTLGQLAETVTVGSSGTGNSNLSFGNIWYGNQDSGFDVYTGWYRAKISNSLGTIYSDWFGLNSLYQTVTYQTGDLGQNCTPCTYECGCNCWQEPNCCCYDSNNDGVTCCDAFPECTDPESQNCCCSAQYCGGTHTVCENCQTCTENCQFDCPASNVCRDCQYYTPIYTTDNLYSTLRHI